MATITATPNPVGIYSQAVGGIARIRWTTRPTPTSAKLFLSTNGGLPQEFPPNQPSNGVIEIITPIDLPVSLGNTYRLILRSATSNPADLATLDVSCFDLRQEMAEEFSASFPQQVRPQAIKNLSVRPGIDVVLVTFKTEKPTIPLIELLDETGAKISARFGLFGGMRTEHEAFFGEDPPLALESKHSIRIVAAGGAKEVEARADFITGSRRADVVFDEVDIFDDSDPGLRGEGEFMFNFGAGDAVTGTSFGPQFLNFGWIGLDPDDDHVPLGQTISIPKAPRQLWVQTIAYESDWTAAPLEWAPPFRSAVSFRPPGTSFSRSDGHQEVTVTDFVDIDHDVGAAVTPFELNPGNYSIAFVMKGHVEVNSSFGQSLTTKSGKMRPRPKAVGPVSEAGMTAFVTPTGRVEDAQVFAYGPDNSLYYRAANRPKKGPELDWTRVELPAPGRAAVAAPEGGKFDLILHREDGGVMLSRNSGKKQGVWRSLGGDFERLVVGATRQKTGSSEVTMFGLDKEGQIRFRSTDGDGGDWQPLGSALSTAIALTEIDGKPVLLALGADRRVRLYTKSSTRWRERVIEQSVPGRGSLTGIAVATPGVSVKGAQEIVIAAMSDDQRIRTLHWSSFPDEPDGAWEDAGSLQDLYTPQRIARGAKTKPAVRQSRAKGNKGKPAR